MSSRKKPKQLRAGMSLKEVIEATPFTDAKYHTHDEYPQSPCLGCELDSLGSELTAQLMRNLIQVVPKKAVE